MQAQALASAFNDVAVRLASAQRDADAQVKAGVDRSTAGSHCLAERVDELGQRERERTLRDKLGVALSSLSQLIDIGVVAARWRRRSRSATVVRWSSRQHVSDRRDADRRLGACESDERRHGDYDGDYRGRVGGLLQVRDGLLPGYTTRLNQLAYGVATSVNTAHRAGPT